VVHEQFHYATDADLFFVVEVSEPPGELVGALDLPCHRINMPYKALCVKWHNVLYGPMLETCKHKTATVCGGRNAWRWHRILGGCI
jgi:hypothetical protein